MAEVLPIRAGRAPAGARRTRIPTAPKHLSAEARRMWRDIAGEWVLGHDALPLLRAALEMWDTYQQARAALAKEGLTVQAGNGSIRAHPAAGIARDSLRECRQLFRQLHLDPPVMA